MATGIIIDFVAMFLGMLIPIIILWMIVFMVGVALIVASLLRVHFDVLNSSLYYLIEEPERGCVNWLLVRHDGEIEVTPAMRKIESYSSSPKLNQQIKEWKTYRFAGHTVRIVGDGTGFSIDLGACVKVRQLKRDYGIKNIFHIRKLFRPSLNEDEIPMVSGKHAKKYIPQEETTTLEEAQKAVDMLPIQPGGV
jgi:hypothetical protein